MKRASKKRVKELRNRTHEILEQFLPKLIPAEQRTSKDVEVVERIAEGIVGKVPSNISEDEADKIEAQLKIAPFLMRRQLAQAVKILPHFPGGQKSKLTQEQRRAMVDDIFSFMRNGLEPREAKVRAAKKYSVSISTVQRIWRNREKNPSDNH
jgi:hypothetical protein